MQHNIEHLQRFTKNFILVRIPIRLNPNYLFINGSFIHQIEGIANYSFIHQIKITAMDTNSAVVLANLTRGWLKSKFLLNYLRC